MDLFFFFYQSLLSINNCFYKVVVKATAVKENNL